ncbi:glycosyltransferase family 4 protein [Acetobacteraceae bacterium KSS8]|uniref:Glycosyltransferase family 4 protein n=1 Tax=Endosaccharibacter trunci TaxID=2812733 RepID=A0ABT1W9A6_9PROT|nr:glycosyltransferase family 4 protein [Acetobacteraceae bacterium KSS8]
MLEATGMPLRSAPPNQHQKPVILQVLPALQTGGVERGTVEMARAIVAAGGTALVASAGGRLVAELERAGAIHLRLGLMTKDPLTILLNAGRLAKLIRRHGVDLVHARSRAPAWSALLAARRTGVPFVTTWHGVYSENFPFKRRYNAVMASGDRVIAISQFVADRISGQYRVGPDRLRVIPRGADAAVFDPAIVRGDRIHALARGWELPDGARVIMLPGRLTAWKGQALLLQALAALRGAPDWVCVMVGPSGSGRDTFGASLVQQAARLGLTANLRFAGACGDMPAAFALADVVVIPSLKPEPFGRTIVEAQAMERVVLASAHGAALETVEHGVSGFHVPPGDAQALARAIEHALALDHDARSAIGAAARASVLERFTARRMQDATLAVYAELLAGRA